MSEPVKPLSAEEIAELEMRSAFFAESDLDMHVTLTHRERVRLCQIAADHARLVAELRPLAPLLQDAKEHGRNVLVSEPEAYQLHRAVTERERLRAQLNDPVVMHALERAVAERDALRVEVAVLTLKIEASDGYSIGRSFATGQLQPVIAALRARIELLEKVKWASEHLLASEAEWKRRLTTEYGAMEFRAHTELRAALASCDTKETT